MAIVKMKKLRVIVPARSKDALMKKIARLGCMEMTPIAPDEEQAEYIEQMQPKSDAARFRAELVSARDILNRYNTKKKGLFAQKAVLSSDEFYDEAVLEKARRELKEVEAESKKLTSVTSEQSKLASQKLMLQPWSGCDIPLDMNGGKNFVLFMGSCPSNNNPQAVIDEICSGELAASAQILKTESDQSYIAAAAHRDDYEAVISQLRRCGFSQISFGSDMTGTAAENIAKIEKLEEELKAEQEGCAGRFTEMAESYLSDIEQAIDVLSGDAMREAADGDMVRTKTTVSLEGWVPAESHDRLTAVLDKYDCAYDFSDPAEGDDVPVLLKSNRITDPLNMVTEMYSLPAYDGVDPNPLIMPFFSMVFGIMYADMGYGIILLILGLIGSKKIKTRGTLKHMTGLLIMCGITTIIWGFLFGSFFGDAVPVFTNLIGIEQKELWKLVDPMQSPMTMLIGSIAVGGIHLFTGMLINFVLLTKSGHFLDALFDVGSWWLVFAGIGVLATGHGPWVLIAGAAALVLTQGRSKPTLIGKLVGGLASLYDITSYFGDILSYTRLMALLLASSVIGSVVNTLGSLSGSVIVFIIVFIIGHLFNMAINIIGTYVHAARLQYLEFFGKFYKDGGRAFNPITFKTKYFTVTEEE